MICHFYLASMAEATVELFRIFLKNQGICLILQFKVSWHLCFESRSKYFKAFSLNTLGRHLLQSVGWNDLFGGFSENFCYASFQFSWVLLCYCFLRKQLLVDIHV